MRGIALMMLALTLPLAAVRAQEPVTASADAEALFTSPDPKLHRNKQATLHIVRDLIEAGHWELADHYLTDRYLEHNPMVKSGRQGMIDFFTRVRKVIPKPIPAKMATPIVAVVAEGDYVIVAEQRERPDPRDPAKRYTTAWFEMWRFVDGKADEHWDAATLPVMPPPPRPAP